MRFRRSSEPSTGIGAVYTAGDARKLRRRRLVRFYSVLFLIVTVFLVASFIDQSWITAQGIVVGDQGLINPISQVRIVKVIPKCLDFVSRGQTIVEVENEITEQTAKQGIQALEIQRSQAQAAQEINRKEAAAAQKYYESQVAVHDQLVAIFNAQNELHQKNYVASLVWLQAKADVIKAETDAEAANYALESKLEDANWAGLEAKLTQDRIDAYAKSPELTGHYELKAPKAGYLTQCNATVGAVVDSSTALFQVFNPTDAFAVVFVSPDDATRVVAGDVVKVQVSGIDGDLDGRISGFYPELSGLPDALTRYFWQQEKWSQYEPVRVDLVNLSDSQRKLLRASAQVSVSLWQLPQHGFFGAITRTIRPSAIRDAQHPG